MILYKAVKIIPIFSQDAEAEKDGFISPYTHTHRYVLL